MERTLTAHSMCTVFGTGIECLEGRGVHLTRTEGQEEAKMAEMQPKLFERRIQQNRLEEKKIPAVLGQSAPEGEGLASCRDATEFFCLVINPASRIL